MAGVGGPPYDSFTIQASTMRSAGLHLVLSASATAVIGPVLGAVAVGVLAPAAQAQGQFQAVDVNQGAFVVVAPLLGSFDFTGVCSRYVDSLGYSARIGAEDLGSGYRLTVRKTANDNLLLAAPVGGAGSKPELLVARTYGISGPVEYLELKLEPGWRLMRRAFAGKRLGHIYLYRDSWPAGGASAPAAAIPVAPVPQLPRL